MHRPSFFKVLTSFKIRRYGKKSKKGWLTAAKSAIIVYSESSSEEYKQASNADRKIGPARGQAEE
jgi:hypothetical protein